MISEVDLQNSYATLGAPVEEQKEITIKTKVSSITGRMIFYVALNKNVQSITLKKTTTGKNITFSGEHIISIEEA